MQVVTFTEVRNNFKKYLDSVVDDGDTVVVGRAKGRSGVIISLKEYNSIKETEYLMSSKKMMEAIRRGEEQLKNGEGIAQADGESIEGFLNRL